MVYFFTGKQHPYQAEFFLELRNIENVLPPAARNEIKKDTKTLWDTEELEFVNITSALDRGGRVPLPLPGYFEGWGYRPNSKRIIVIIITYMITYTHTCLRSFVFVCTYVAVCISACMLNWVQTSRFLNACWKLWRRSMRDSVQLEARCPESARYATIRSTA